MKIKIAKKITCEVEIFNGDVLVDKYIAKENELVTKNPLGHRPIKNIEWTVKTVDPIKYKT